MPTGSFAGSSIANMQQTEKSASGTPQLIASALVGYVLFLAIAQVIVHHVNGSSYGTIAYLRHVLPYLIVACVGLVAFFKFRLESRLVPPWDEAGNKALYLVIFIPVLALSIATLILSATTDNPIVLPVFLTLLVGITEELGFRRILFVFLLKRTSLLKAATGSAVIFSVAHSINILSGAPLKQVTSQLLFTFVAGLMLSLLYEYTRWIYAVIVLHWLWDYILLSGIPKDNSIVSIAVVILLITQILLTATLVFRHIRHHTRTSR